MNDDTSIVIGIGRGRRKGSAAVQVRIGLPRPANFLRIVEPEGGGTVAVGDLSERDVRRVAKAIAAAFEAHCNDRAGRVPAPAPAASDNGAT